MLALRTVDEGDEALLFSWANDPLVRRMSLSSDPIPIEAHRAWLRSKLADPRCWFYLALDDTPIGQVRFDGRGDREAIVSMSLAPEHRGRRLASPVIRLATERAALDGGLVRIDADIKLSNLPSLRAFARAGYASAGRDDLGALERWTWIRR
jgi:RimJ/RimL family protein N-acetyltransferase